MSSDTDFAVKRGASVIYSVVQTVILGLSVALIVYVAKTQQAHSEMLVEHRTILATHGIRLDSLDVRQVNLNSQRVSDMDEVRRALGAIQVMNLRLETIEKAEGRIESKLDKHLDTAKP